MSTELLSSAAATGGVKTVAIVDDAYDPPKPNEISENSFNLFVRKLEEHGEAFNEISGFSCLSREDIDDWDEFLSKEELITALWNGYVGTRSDLEINAFSKEALNTLFDEVNLDRRSKLLQLKPLETLLENIGVKIVRLGSEPKPEVVATANVVFLDLYLSELIPPEIKPGDPTPKSVYDKARDRAIEYLQMVRNVTNIDMNAIAPAFILISSQGSDVKAENFRKRAGQMASRFRFVSKQNLRDNKPHELLAIADIFRTCNACAIIEPIQKACPKILADSVKWATEKLSELDISDFGHLYQLRLHDEGQPLADYVKEIVAGAVAERICCAFGDITFPVQEENPFKSVPSYFQAPSNGFAELYSATRISQDKGYRGKSNYDPQSGDIFLRGQLPEGRLTGHEVMAVMSPACDLIDRDGTGARAKSILLLEGVIKPVTFKIKQQDPQILCVGNDYYEVHWAMKCPSTVKIDTIRKDWKDHKFTWLGRLKGEHFLSLQSTYLSDLGRVGVMKSPMVYESLAGEILARDGGAFRSFDFAFTAKRNYAYLFSDQKEGSTIDKQQIAFSGVFVQRFSELLSELKDGDIPGHIKAKVNHIIETASARILNFTEKKVPSAHSIQNYLTIEVHTSRDVAINEHTNGVIIIKLWPE